VTQPPRRDEDRDGIRDGRPGSPPAGRLGRRAAAAYQGAIEAVLAVVITTGAGYWLDRRFETGSTFLLVGIVIGFCSFALRLWRMRHLMVATPEEVAAGAGSATSGATTTEDRERDERRRRDDA